MYETQGLNPADFLSLITRVVFSGWGSDLQIECVIDAVDRQVWILHFKKCSEINWYIHEPEALLDEEAQLISFRFGKDQHKEPAMIGTDIFDVSVRYEAFELYKRQ
jgi:hypothetical protein